MLRKIIKKVLSYLAHRKAQKARQIEKEQFWKMLNDL